MRVFEHETGERFVLVYRYDSAGYFIGFDEADESPLEPGIFLIPAQATDVEPPPDETGKRKRWTGSAWILEDIPGAPDTAEQTADQVRSQRNGLLLASDFTQLSDVPISSRSEWETYRQALRDIPEQPGFPGAVIWPTPPTYSKI